MNRLEKARDFRKRIDANLQATRKLIRVDELSEEELLDMIDLYENYEVGKSYQTDDIFQYEGKLYKVIQEHTSQTDWKPDELPALYWKIQPAGIIPEWVQPVGSVGIYQIGDKVTYNGQVYESTAANNVWSPDEYGWILYLS